MDKFVKVSIIMPSFNQGEYIERAIQSVINQNYKNSELIVLDGGSSDNTVEIIKKYQSAITFWRSNKDDGQSAAINEGFKRATGDFVTWLNSDDVLMPNILSKLNFYVHHYPYCRFFLGNLIWIDKNDHVLKAIKSEPYSSLLVKKGIFSNGGPSAFLRKDILEQYGYLREDFSYMMDTEYWNRLIFNGEQFIRIKDFCWCLRLHENAKMSGHLFKKDQVETEKELLSREQQFKEQEIINTLYTYEGNKTIYSLFLKIFKLMHVRIVASHIYSYLIHGKSLKTICERMK